jgi:hypothetical protein
MEEVSGPSGALTAGPARSLVAAGGSRKTAMAARRAHENGSRWGAALGIAWCIAEQTLSVANRVGKISIANPDAAGANVLCSDNRPRESVKDALDHGPLPGNKPAAIPDQM